MMYILLQIRYGVIEFIDSSFKTYRVSGNNSSSKRLAFVTNDGELLLFVASFSDGGERKDVLFRVDLTSSELGRSEIASDVRSFIASKDGKAVFYVNSDQELWCVKGKKKSAKIADFVSGLAMSNNSNKVFFMSEEGLHYSDNGKKSVKITGDVIGVWSRPTNVFYLTSNFDVYRSGGNEKFTLFQQDVNVQNLGY